MAAESVFIHIIISLSILLFSAKIFAEIFQRIKQPVVLGELLAGIIVGPYALGGLPLFDGQPLVVLDETLKHIGALAAIVILFIAGLEITPREFLRGGAASNNGKPPKAYGPTIIPANSSPNTTGCFIR